jgi:hypothetical protein
MLKKWSLLGMVFAVLLTMIPFAHAQEDKVSGSFSVDLMSQYIWRGCDCTDSAVVQPDLSVTYQDFTVDFWADYDAGGTSDIDEVDFTLDYSHSFKVGMGELTPSIGYIYYDMDVGDTQEVYVGLSYSQELMPDLGLNIGFTVYRDVDTVHSTYLEGNFGLDYGIKSVTVSPYLTVGYYWYDNADDDWNNVELGMDVSFAITGPISGHAKIAYSFGNDDMGVDDEFYGGVGISFEF